MVHWSWDGGLSNLASRCVHIQPILLLRSAQHGPDCICPRIRVVKPREVDELIKRVAITVLCCNPLQIQTITFIQGDSPFSNPGSPRTFINEKVLEENFTNSATRHRATSRPHLFTATR